MHSDVEIDNEKIRGHHLRNLASFVRLGSRRSSLAIRKYSKDLFKLAAFLDEP